MTEKDYGPPIKCTYGGNNIYLDRGMLFDVRNEINLMGQELCDQSENCKRIDSWFNEIDERYASLFPNPRFAEIASEVEIFAGAGGAVQNIQDELNKIESAIVDYSNGDGFFDLNNNQFLNNLLGVDAEPNEYTPPYTPYNPPGNGGAPDADSDDEDKNGDGAPDNEDTDNDNSTGSDAPDNNNGGFRTFNPYSSSVSTSEPAARTAAQIATMMGVEDLDGDGEIDAEELSSAFTSLGASGNSSFFVPSLTSGKTDGVKSSGVIGAAGVVAAAVAAIGGKVYYDKQKEDDDDETLEEDSDEIVALEEETGSEVLDEEPMSSLNMVEFKEELLHIGEGDE